MAAYRVPDVGCPGWCPPGSGFQIEDAEPFHPLMPRLRREALWCIPGSAGRDSKGGSWVWWLTWTGNRKGTIACQES